MKVAKIVSSERVYIHFKELWCLYCVWCVYCDHLEPMTDFQELIIPHPGSSFDLLKKQA